MYTPFKALTYSRNISPSRLCLFFASSLHNSPCTSSMCCVGSATKGNNRMNRTFVDLAQEPRKHRLSILTDFSLYTTSFHSIEHLRIPHIWPKNCDCACRRFCSSKLYTNFARLPRPRGRKPITNFWVSRHVSKTVVVGTDLKILFIMFNLQPYVPRILYAVRSIRNQNHGQRSNGCC